MCPFMTNRLTAPPKQSAARIVACDRGALVWFLGRPWKTCKEVVE